MDVITNYAITNHFLIKSKCNEEYRGISAVGSADIICTCNQNSIEKIIF